MYCYGELCTVFMLTVGGLSVFVLACMISYKLLERSVGTGETMFPYGILFLILTAIFIILAVAAVPFGYGVSWYRIQQIRGISVPARSIFSCYTSAKKLWKVIRLQSILIFKSLHIVIPAALVSAAMFYIAGIVDAYAKGDTAYYIIFFAAMLTAFAMLGVTAYYSVRFSAVPYLYALGPEKPIPELIDESRKIMKDKEKYISEVMFSLSMWLLPCLIIFPMIFIIPYMQMVYAAAVNEIIIAESGAEKDSDGSFNVEVPVSV